MAKSSSRKPRAAVPENETKAQKFSRLATARVRKAVKTLDSIGQLSNRSGYEYTDEQVGKIDAAIKGAWVKSHERFTSGGKVEDTTIEI